MAIYTVHAPRGEAPPEADALKLQFIKDGFCWPALFFAPLWLIFRRQWLTLLAYVLVLALFGVAGQSVGSQAMAPAVMLFALWFALEANQFRRWTLERWGWRFVGVAVGRNRLEAEDGYFRDLLAGPRPPQPPVSPAPPARSGSVPAIGGAAA